MGRTPAEQLRALERLHDERTLFEPATRRVIEAALAQAGIDGTRSPVVEIGSGGGQLRRWLPEALLPAMVHTEPERAFVGKLRQAAPAANAQVASAQALPFADGSVAGVLGLCVLDVVDLPAVTRELHRVLAPGAAMVQFWDMAPSMTWLCEQQISEGSVLLPSCFADPLVRAELPAALQAALPPLDFLQDLLSIPVDHLQGLIALLRPSPTDLIDASALERLARYVDQFRAGTAAEAARSLAWLGDDEPEAFAYKRLLLTIWVMLQQAQGGGRLPLDLRPVSSAQALSAHLRDAFTPTGMQVTCEVRRARAVVPRPPIPSGPAGERLARARFAGRWLGTTAYAAEIPPAAADVIPESKTPAPDQLVVEAGVLVLTVRR